MATFTNTATLSYSGGTVNSNTVSGTVQDELTVVKTAVNDNYTVGDNLTYVISLVNTGGCAFNGLNVTDDLGAYFSGNQRFTPLAYNTGTVRYYVNGILQEPPGVILGQNLMFTGISVPAGGNALIIYEARVTRCAPPDNDGVITNTATVTGESLAQRITALSTVRADASPALTISKAVCPPVVSANGTITYTFTIQNSGNTEAVATDDIVLTDTFDPRLNITSVTFNGMPWSPPDNYTYSMITGQFSTVLGQITVPSATYSRDSDCGWVVTPGVSTLTVTGTVI